MNPLAAPAAGSQPYRMEVRVRQKAPLLRSVPRAYILTMEKSERLTADLEHSLRRLCVETRVQYNRGWQAGGKDPRVNAPGLDLIDAYRHACADASDLGGAPVLFLEEDAIFMNFAELDAEKWAEVDHFLTTESQWDAYSLGSFGEFVLPLNGHHRRFRGIMASSQAVIWSARARRLFLGRKNPYEHPHIDSSFLSTLASKYTYHEPLVVQLFPLTPNQCTWCYWCNDSYADKCAVRVWVWLMQKGLGLDHDPAGWDALYHLSATLGAMRMLFPLVLLLAVVVAVQKMRRRGRHSTACEQ